MELYIILVQKIAFLYIRSNSFFGGLMSNLSKLVQDIYKFIFTLRLRIKLLSNLEFSNLIETLDFE